jgi:hypothetical protein
MFGTDGKSLGLWLQWMDAYCRICGARFACDQDPELLPRNSCSDMARGSEGFTWISYLSTDGRTDGPTANVADFVLS